MSREIRFRAWHKPSRKMADVGFMLVWENCREKLGTKLISGWDEDVEFMQYTGLKDWEGKGLYEGDILGTNKGGELEAHGHIVFDTDFAEFVIRYTNGGWAELWQHLGEKTNQGRELIGNIYQNPELLTKGDSSHEQ